LKELSYKLLIKFRKFQEYKNVFRKLKLRSASDCIDTRLFNLNTSLFYHEFQKDNFATIESAF